MPLLISLKVALSATLITFGLGVPIAYFMASYRGRGQALLDSLLLLPLVLPPTVIGFLLLWLLGNQGPLHALLPAFPNLVFTGWAAVITAVVVAFPLMYRTSRAAFSQVDPQLSKVAQTLGASEWTVFRRVAVPLAGPGLVAGTLLTFARSLGEFGATLMLAGNIPGKTQTLPMAVYFAVEGGDFATATRWSLVIVAIAGLSVVLANEAGWNRKIAKSSPQTQYSAQHKSQHKQAAFLNSSAPLGIPSPSEERLLLNVDISKQIGHFTLEVSFKTTDRLLSVLGESGAGKSLLLRCLAGIDTPDRGRIVLGEQILFDSQQKINVPSRDRNIALLFQNYALFPHLTVAQNVSFGLKKPANSATKDNRAIVTQELAAVGMSQFADDYPQQLSGGQQQRVALARALAARPKMLLLDEPFSALDTHLRSHLSQQLFSRLSTFAGTTLLVTHNLTEAYRAHQLVVLHQGQSVQQGKPKRVFKQPKTKATAQLTGPCNLSAAQLPHPSKRPFQKPSQGSSRGFSQESHRIYAQHWQMSLCLPENIFQSSAQQHYSVGIRPQNISFMTPAQYESRQNSPNSLARKSPARMAFPNTPRSPRPKTLATNWAYGWLAHYWYRPDSVIVLVKLHQPAHSPNDYHLQVMVSHKTWQQQQQQLFPWIVHLPSQHLILLRL